MKQRRKREKKRRAVSRAEVVAEKFGKYCEIILEDNCV